MANGETAPSEAIGLLARRRVCAWDGWVGVRARVCAIRGGERATVCRRALPGTVFEATLARPPGGNRERRGRECERKGLA